MSVISLSPEILVTDWEGNPLNLSPNRSIFAMDTDRNPLFFAVAQVEPGHYRLELGNRERFIITAVLDAPGFGHLRCVADRGGEGYDPNDFRVVPMNLNRELARSRALLTLGLFDTWTGNPSPELKARANRVREGLYRLESEPDVPIGEWGKLLGEAMWFGEEIAVEQARERIASSPKREGYLFGANCFAAPRGIPDYRDLYTGLFNFGTVPFYLKTYEPEPGQIRDGHAQGCLTFLEENGLASKGHPLVWLFRGTMPAWLDGKSFEEVREIVRERVIREVTRYRGRIDIWDVINEAHDWANCYGYSSDELIELTRTACEAAADANPEAVRIVNSCFVFGDYVAWGRGHEHIGPPRPILTPYRYVEALAERKVPFEVIGLQLYYAGYDLLEHRMLFDRFACFNRPIHITEVAVPSSMEEDPESHYKGPDAVRNMGIWRRPWNPEVQADWIEAFYTICYAHPAVEAVTWWDFSDVPGHFFPHGGFQAKDGTPKPGYERLKGLLEMWGF